MTYLPGFFQESFRPDVNQGIDLNLFQSQI
jgi:hypothetical protein